jgi:diguanylate cyclase (GGDEF)-like protein
VIEFHDDAYRAWRHGIRTGDWDEATPRAQALIERLDSAVGLHLRFYEADNHVSGKTRDHYSWFSGLAEPEQRDPLTGLKNRRTALQLIERAASEGAEFGVIEFDLDTLKEQNDRHGSWYGDLLIHHAAAAAGRALGAEFEVFRIGGDEFAAFIRRKTSIRELVGSAERVRVALEPNRLEDAQLAGLPRSGSSAWPRRARRAWRVHAGRRKARVVSGHGVLRRGGGANW